MVKRILLLFLLCLFSSNTKAQLFNCLSPQDMTENLICQDLQLYEIHLTLNKKIQNLTDIPPDVLSLYNSFFKTKLNLCFNHDCIAQLYKEADTWFKNKKYLNTLPLKKKCPIKNISAECEIYTFSQYAPGRISQKELISNQHETRIAEVKINRPGRCVILFLSAYEPVIWDIYTSPQTGPVSVIASGYYTPMLRGMKKDTEALISKRTKEKKLCIEGYQEKLFEKVQELDVPSNNIVQLEKSIIGEELALNAYDYNPQIYIGEYILTALRLGKQGLEQLIKEGKLKQITSHDINLIKSYGFDYYKGPHPIENALDYVSFRNGYIMLEDFSKLPGGLYGANSITLFVPEDLIPPSPNGHSSLYKLKVPSSVVKYW